MYDLARPIDAECDDDGWEVQLPRAPSHYAYVVLEDALALRSCWWRILPATMHALQTEISARLPVDAYLREDYESRLYSSKACESAERHRRWREMLLERLQILRRGYGKWYGNTTASLFAICNEMVRVSLME